MSKSFSANGIIFLAKRYLRSKRRGKGLTAPFLSILGLVAGVLTLNAVLAVMNGFQLTFIESILEISSSHIRWENSAAVSPNLVAKVKQDRRIRSIQPYYEAQTMVVGAFGNQHGALLRGLSPKAFEEDKGLKEHLKIDSGSLGLSEQGQVLVGSELARSIGVTVGDQISLLTLGGENFSLLSPQSKTLTISGIFHTGYYEIDADWVLVSLKDAKENFATEKDFHYGIKLYDENRDLEVSHDLARLTGQKIENFVTWREFNSAFFGALRTEKNAMMILIGLIFLVVGLNIFYSQRRTIQEHAEDIAVWRALGMQTWKVRSVFTLEGVGIGLAGAVIGTCLGLLTAYFIPQILMGVQNLINFISSLCSSQNVVLFSSQAFYLPALPSRILPSEVVLIASFAFLSAVLASWLASSRSMKIPIAEVLKNE